MWAYVRLRPASCNQYAARDCAVVGADPAARFLRRDQTRTQTISSCLAFCTSPAIPEISSSAACNSRQEWTVGSFTRLDFSGPRTFRQAKNVLPHRHTHPHGQRGSNRTRRHHSLSRLSRWPHHFISADCLNIRAVAEPNIRPGTSRFSDPGLGMSVFQVMLQRCGWQDAYSIRGGRLRPLFSRFYLAGAPALSGEIVGRRSGAQMLTHGIEHAGNNHVGTLLECRRVLLHTLKAEFFLAA